MKILSTLLLVALFAALPLACKSAPASAEIPCTCGTPEADLQGCAHPLCLAGKNNPDNPNCVCGKLEVPGAKK